MELACGPGGRKGVGERRKKKKEKEKKTHLKDEGDSGIQGRTGEII